MTDPIYVNGSQQAALRHPKGTTEFATVQHAVAHWRRLTPATREHTVLVVDKNVYQPTEIGFLRYGPHL